MTVSPIYNRRALDGVSEWVAGDSATTDDRGEYRLADLSPGEYLINFLGPHPLGIPIVPDPAAGAPEQGSIPPMLYPGVAEIEKGTFVQVKGGEETRLNTAVLGQTRFGAIRLHVTNPSTASAKDAGFECCSRPRTSSNLTGDVTFGGLDGLNVLTERMEPGADSTRLYWPNRVGLYRLAVTWKTGDESNALYANIPFTGSDVEVPVVLEKPQGRLSLQLTQASTGAAVPVARATVSLGRSPLVYPPRAPN